MSRILKSILVASERPPLKKRAFLFLWVGCLGDQERVIEVIYVSYYHFLFFIKHFLFRQAYFTCDVATVYETRLINWRFRSWQSYVLRLKMLDSEAFFYCPSQAILSWKNMLSFSLFNYSGKRVVWTMSFKIWVSFKFYFYSGFKLFREGLCWRKNLTFVSWF